jgi:type I restriction enzyme S subunit
LRKVVIADEKCLCSADVYPVHVDDRRVDPSWLAWTLLSDRFTAYAISASARARMPKLNRDQLFSYPIALPPLEIQRQVAREISGRISATNKVRHLSGVHLRDIEALSAALLRRAFATQGAA